MLKCSNENVAERVYCVMRPTWTYCFGIQRHILEIQWVTVDSPDLLCSVFIVKLKLIQQRYSTDSPKHHGATNFCCKCMNDQLMLLTFTLQRQHYVMFLFLYGYRHQLCVKSFMFFELQIVISVITALWSNRLIE